MNNKKKQKKTIFSKLFSKFFKILFKTNLNLFDQLRIYFN